MDYRIITKELMNQHPDMFFSGFPDRRPLSKYIYKGKN